jgi:hypothetical protein
MGSCPSYLPHTALACTMFTGAQYAHYLMHHCLASRLREWATVTCTLVAAGLAGLSW